MGSRSVILGLVLACAIADPASAQQSGPGNSFGQPGGQPGGRRGAQLGPNRDPIPDQSANPNTSDPAAYDAIGLFSRLCVSTRGNRARATGIVGSGDGAIEKMDAPLLRGMENGRDGGVGWIIKMPLGDTLLLEFPADGSCIVRVPRVSPPQLEQAFHNLMEQFAGSGQFDIRREGEQTKAVDLANPDAAPKPNDDVRHPGDKLKYHIQVYSMRVPDIDRSVQLVLATTPSDKVSIQGVMSYQMQPDQLENPRP